MKRNKLIIGSAGIIAVAAIVLLSTWKSNDFEKSNSINKASKIEVEQNEAEAITPSASSNQLGSETKEPLRLATNSKETNSTIEFNEHFIKPRLKKSALEHIKWLNERFKDTETGELITKEKHDIIKAQVAKMTKNKIISFTDLGPDNIGGRTRAICLDRNDPERVWSGGVSGGLFISTNHGNLWNKVSEYTTAGGSPFISSITQTPDGTVYVASGSSAEYGVVGGGGVFYSADGSSAWAAIPGFTGTCNEIVSSDANNTVWLATSSGVKKWNIGDPAVTSVPVTSGQCNALQISKDGNVLVAGMGSNKTFVSNDGGNTWMDKSGTGSGNVPSGSPRIEYAISPIKNAGTNNYSLYAVRTNSNLLGMSVSHDNGNTWYQFVGASGSPSLLDIYGGQGTWNSCITVHPTNTKKIFIAGIDVWSWEQTTTGVLSDLNPPSGGFEKVSWYYDANYQANPGDWNEFWDAKYVHPDIHELKWDSNNRLYVGTDGGIFISNDMTETFYAANRGYGITQFVAISHDRNGSVFGGTQDNGTLYNNYSLNTMQEFRQVTGGDGGFCEISFFNPEVAISSSQSGTMYRTGDRFNSVSTFFPDFPSTYGAAGAGNYPFQTYMKLAEYYDLNSRDSVTWIPDDNYPTGSTLKIPSRSTGDTMVIETTFPLFFSDTVNFDPLLTQSDISVVNAINNQTVYLGNYTWTPFASASQQNPPLVGDSLMVNFPAGADTVVVESTGTYDHYYVTNPATGELYSLGNEETVYNVAWNSITVQDPYQSWFLFYTGYNGGELWGTRNALRLSAQDEQWVNIARGIGGASNDGTNLSVRLDIEFTKDLKHCYITAGSGGLWRLDGLDSLYSTDPGFEQKAGWVGSPVASPPTNTTLTQIKTGAYEGLALNPNNSGDLILFEGFSGTNERCTGCDGAAPTWANLANITNPQVACFDGIIDRENPAKIVVGTSEGVFVSESNGSAGSWQNSSEGFDGTPVFAVKQAWRTWEEGNARPGEIYIGTYGRGIWSSTDYLGLTDNSEENSTIEGTSGNLKLYPNPTSDVATITFNLEELSDVNINVYSISGVLVETLSNKNMSIGDHSFTIETSNLPKGTYLVKFNAGSQNETLKFIKM